MSSPETMDRLARRTSLAHRLPAGAKAAAALALIVTLAAWRGAPAVALGLIAALLASAAAISRLPWRHLLLRLFLFLPLTLSLAVLAGFTPGGWRTGAHLAARSLLCLVAAILFAGTTPFSEVLRLLRQLRLPPLMATALALAYRYAFLFVDEARRMQTARCARCFSASKRREAGWRAALIGRLLLRSLERSERVYAAMLARGWR